MSRVEIKFFCQPNFEHVIMFLKLRICLKCIRSPVLFPSKCTQVKKTGQWLLQSMEIMVKSLYFYDLGLILHNGKTEYNKQSVKIVLSAESRLMLFLGKVILQMFRYTSIYLFTTPPIRLLVRTQTVSLYQQLSL